MRNPPAIERLDLAGGPLDVLAAWSVDRPAIVLHSGGGGGNGNGRAGWSRWSIVAQPAGWLTCDGTTSRLSGAVPDDGARARLTGDALADFDTVLTTTRLGPEPADGVDLPFRGGWIGFIAYELGRTIEPTAGGRARPAEWPLLQMAWCPRALVHDHVTGVWHVVGNRSDVPTLRAGAEPAAPAAGPWTRTTPPADYLDAVTRTIDYIRAGDVFQANVTHRLSAPFVGCTRTLARRALAASGAWYGAYLELPEGRAICSMSPELFLSVDPQERRVRTRPIKGTRPRRVARGDLARSEKDAAELHMIVDLMRNDLGRVCRFGTVNVPCPRAIETHGTVHHGVGEVTGVLRDDVSVGDLLRATFPPGSITGAPKIRAMQIIDALEPLPRGPYCGAVGFVSDHGAVGLNVAIRTMALRGRRPDGRWDRLDGVLDYGVGGGIVADSEPDAEYRESLDKAAVLGEVFGDGGRVGDPA